MQEIERIHKIQRFMAQIGVSEVETGIYLKLLEFGATSLSDLAKKMKMPRTTVFENTEKLVDKGLVTRTVRGKRRLLVAEEPGKVKRIVDAKELEIVSKQKEIESVKSGLDGFVKNVIEMVPKVLEKSEVKVRYYEGEEEVLMVYRNSLKSDKAYSFANLDKYYEIFPGTIDMWEEALINNPKRQVWDILVNTPLARKIGLEGDYERYYVKIFPDSQLFKGFEFSDYVIYENKVAMIQLQKGNTVATVIDSKHMSMSLIALHQTLWRFLP